MSLYVGKIRLVSCKVTLGSNAFDSLYRSLNYIIITRINGVTVNPSDTSSYLICTKTATLKLKVRDCLIV